MPIRNLRDTSTLGEDGTPAGDKMKLGGDSQIPQETHEKHGLPQKYASEGCLPMGNRSNLLQK